MLVGIGDEHFQREGDGRGLSCGQNVRVVGQADVPGRIGIVQVYRAGQFDDFLSGVVIVDDDVQHCLTVDVGPEPVPHVDVVYVAFDFDGLGRFDLHRIEPQHLICVVGVCKDRGLGLLEH